MSNELTGSPYLINKACLKIPLRSITGNGYVESHHKTHLLKIMRKTDSYNAIVEPERYHKDKALEFLRRRRDDIEEKTSKSYKVRRTFDIERDLDRLSKRIVEDEENSKKLDMIYAESKNPEVKKKSSKSSGYNVNNKDQKLRSAIHQSLTNEKVKQLFDNYKKFYFSQKMRHLSNEERSQMEHFINIKENEIKDFEDFFVVHALRMADTTVKNLLNVPETKEKDLVKITAPHEPMREIEEIVKKELEVNQEDPVAKLEQKHWIDVFQTVDLAITNFKFQKPELRYKRMNNFLQVIARPYTIFREAEKEFEKMQMKSKIRPKDRHNRNMIKSEQGMRNSLSTSLRSSKEWRQLKNDLTYHQIPQNLSPSRPDSRTPSEAPSSFFITNPRGLPDEIPKVIRVSSLINSHNPADLTRIPMSANRAIAEETSESGPFAESPKLIHLTKFPERAQTAAKDRTRHSDGLTEAPTARTSRAQTPFVYERNIYERGKSAESIWKNSMMLSERPQFAGIKSVKQDFRDFYDKYGDMMMESSHDTKRFLQDLDQQKDMLDVEVNNRCDIQLDTVLANAPDQDTKNFKSCLQLKKRIVTKLVESVENKDEVLVALQKRNSAKFMTNTLGKSLMQKAAKGKIL